jgi:thymidine phosphorylase
MKTTVKNTHGGNVTASRIGPVLIALEVYNPLEENGQQVAYMTIDHAYVLAQGIIRLAEQAEAEKEAQKVPA